MKKDRIFKNLLIYPQFQILLVIVNCLFIFLSFSLVYYGVYSGFDSLKQAGVKAKVSAAHPFFNYLDFQETYILQYLIIALILSLILTIIFSLLLSHKVVGPLKRLKNDLEKSLRGEDVKFEFRKGDFFKEIPLLINDLIEKNKNGK